MPALDITVVVEIALGADLTAAPGTWSWTDISAYLQQAEGAKVNIKSGRSDEDGSAQASSLSIRLDNADGRFTRLNPNSPYYGLLALNTPIRVTVVEGANAPSIRFAGHVSELPTRWGANDNLRWIPLRADGVIRRFEKSDAVRSPLRVWMSSLDPIAYWPLEDEEGSLSGASEVEGVTPMQSVAELIDFGSIKGPPGGADTPDIPTGVFAGLVGYPVGVSEVSWSAKVAFRYQGNGSGSDYTLVIYTDNPGSGIERFNVFVQQDTSIQCIARREDGSSVGFTSVSAATEYSDAFDGEWHALSVFAQQVGSDIRLTLHYDSFSNFVILSGESLGQVTQISTPWSLVYDSDNTSRSISHVAMFNGLVDYNTSNPNENFLVALNGHAGETAVARMTRLCAQEQVPFIAIEGDEPSERLGAQPLDKLIEILRDAEHADGGILFESTDHGLTYIARSRLYEKAISDSEIDMTVGASQFAAGFDMQDDDQAIANDVTVKRDNGSSARRVDEGHIQKSGRYSVSDTVNVETDDRTNDYAQWQLTQGTLDKYRYPGVSLIFPETPELLTDWLATGLGGRVYMDTPPAGLPPEEVDMLIQGYSETIMPRDWRVSINASPVANWRVSKLDDATYGRADTAGSELDSSATTTATTISVDTTSGPEWITTASHPDEFPFDINVGGERMTVTAISDGIPAQIFTVTRSVNGIVKAHDIGSAVGLHTTTYLAL